MVSLEHSSYPRDGEHVDPDRASAHNWGLYSSAEFGARSRPAMDLGSSYDSYPRLTARVDTVGSPEATRAIVGGRGSYGSEAALRPQELTRVQV